MIVCADLHLHSKYSRATSQSMDLENIAAGARLKGLNLLGTGDFTHPKWFSELKKKLRNFADGIYLFDGIYWTLTCEVSLIYPQDGKSRRVHHIIHAPSIEVVESINSSLSRYGNLNSDGRPTFTRLTSPELVDLMSSIDPNIVIIPSHAWTTWYGVFGANTGFDSLEECFGDQARKIFAIETGLSSTPQMNWRISALDKVSLVSNSDSHSPLPSRLGREFNVFQLSKPSYRSVFEAVKNHDRSKFLYTVEVPPEYGKYHYTGHRNCKFSLSPKEALKINNICPVCGKRLTIGVLQRVEELADRPEGYEPTNAVPFKVALPLYEVISLLRGSESLYSKKISEEELNYIKKAGNEISILIDIKRPLLDQIVGSEVASLIEDFREKKVRFDAGYDGLYGKPILHPLS
ncbi:MAG: endonuclease Q family protein [Nitrososphaeria archaeon]